MFKQKKKQKKWKKKIGKKLFFKIIKALKDYCLPSPYELILEV